MTVRIPPSSLPGIAPLDRGTTPAAPSAPAGSFGDIAREAIAGAEQGQADATNAATKLAVGEGNVHEAALLLEKADIQMRLLVKARNKVVEAYQEIMRMPV
ncbi:MAG: flagellar hook-basal body complex protein FliE [Deltaproteobacteria bacterium]|nr:flagellar hook-basal body complex protein FliE [Deltaproteobacteria bacterium]